jgi:NADH dehydrogenase
LLYQVATGGLSAGDIAQPPRTVSANDAHVSVLMGAAVDVALGRQTMQLRQSTFPYETAVIATGAGPGYFGHDDWAQQAPGLKTVGDALEIRCRCRAARL